MIDRIKGFWNQHSKEILIIGVFVVFIFAGQSNYKIAATVSTANEVIEEKDITAEAWKDLAIKERTLNIKKDERIEHLQGSVKRAWEIKRESDSSNVSIITNKDREIFWLKKELKKVNNEKDSLLSIVLYRDRVRYVPGGGNEP